MENPNFTPREILLIEHAAEMAAVRITNGIYQEVGKTLISKLYIVIGAAAVAIASWIHFGDKLTK